jgi:hypothetical protein
MRREGVGGSVLNVPENILIGFSQKKCIAIQPFGSLPTFCRCLLPLKTTMTTDFRSQPAADDEVAELVWQLRTKSATEKANRRHYSAKLLTRAADLLECRYPQPIPVSERLPELKDCAPWSGTSDASVWCWVGSDFDYGWKWQQRSAVCLRAFPDGYTHWLPAHALPLPSGEVNQ